MRRSKRTHESTLAPMENLNPPIEELLTTVYLDVMEQIVEGTLPPFIEGEQLGVCLVRVPPVVKLPAKLLKEIEEHYDKQARYLVNSPTIPNWFREDLERRLYVRKQELHAAKKRATRSHQTSKRNAVTDATDRPRAKSDRKSAHRVNGQARTQVTKRAPKRGQDKSDRS